jgi:uncharacterized protein YukE
VLASATAYNNPQAIKEPVMAKNNTTATTQALVKAVISKSAKIREFAREANKTFDENGKCNAKALLDLVADIPQMAEDIANIVEDIKASFAEVKPAVATKPAAK